MVIQWKMERYAFFPSRLASPPTHHPFPSHPPSLLPFTIRIKSTGSPSLWARLGPPKAAPSPSLK